jgi:hypothetical protein
MSDTKKNLITAKRLLEIYAMPVIGTEEIKEVFDCGVATANRRRAAVAPVMMEKEIIQWKPGYIDPRVAFEVWGFDIEGITTAYKKMLKLGVVK